MSKRSPSTRFATLILAVLAMAVLATPAWAKGVPDALKQSGLNLMPWPAHISLQKGQLTLSSQFNISVTGNPGHRVYDAANRVLQHLQIRTGLFLDQHRVTDKSTNPEADLVIRVKRPGKLEIGEDESYQLTINSQQAVLTATDGLGALHGLQTLLQLVQTGDKGYYLPAVTIRDQPRFKWRGLMIDVARNFQPMHVIKRNIRGMTAVKMNVLHLHLSDNQGFRIQSKTFPKLAKMGSFDNEYFTQAQMKEIIRYAGDRGIIVVPEFDLPAHAQAWFVSHPELASAPGPFPREIHFGARNPSFDPTNPKTYTFLAKFFGEMAKLFPGPYMHIGGDENYAHGWTNNPAIQAYMQPDIKTNAELQTEFINKLAKIVHDDGKQVIGWDEVLQPGIPADTIIQVWRGKKSLYEAARKGHRTILSDGYYLDLLHSAAFYYKNDPIPAGTQLSPEARKNILGGEAEQWSELVRPATIDSRIWPSTAAIAERLWSPRDVNDVDWMYTRLHVVSLWLEARGLMHLHAQAMLLRELSNGYDTKPLKVLVDVIAPVQGYDRVGSRTYSVFSPLASLADAATANPWAAIQFKQWVEQYADTRDAASESKIRTQLKQWIANDPALEKVIAQSPRLHAAKPLAQSLAALSKIGLRALDYLDNNQPAPREWAKNTTDDFLAARKSAIATELHIVDPIEQLVVMAVKG
ncbi:MAG TPA: beta-N-acetylhexosaminidase [Oleiagrimonas sp.]|nr:beta-N-acetylhexosaminidase [Oleiagrimonas sp.]